MTWNGVNPYQLAAQGLGVSLAECLVVEDSLAGMQVIAVSTPFARQRLHESGLLREGFDCG